MFLWLCPSGVSRVWGQGRASFEGAGAGLGPLRGRCTSRGTSFSVCPLRPPGEPYGKRVRLVLTLCPLGPPGRRSETSQDDYNNGRACAKGNGTCCLFIGVLRLWERCAYRCTVFIGAQWGSGPCGGRPLRRLRATPPLSGEARPKCRLRRLAVGLLTQPFGGTVPCRCLSSSAVRPRF